MPRLFRLFMLAVFIQGNTARPRYLQDQQTQISTFQNTSTAGYYFNQNTTNVTHGTSSHHRTHRHERSVGTPSANGNSQHQRQLSYISSQLVKFRLKGNSQEYLLGQTDGVQTGVQVQGQNQVCFRVHTFTATPPYPAGYVAAFEAPAGGNVAQGSGSSISFTSNTGLRQVTSIDGRIFLVSPEDAGSAFVRIKHLSSGRFLSADDSGVSLEPLDSRSDDFLFEKFPCTNNT